MSQNNCRRRAGAGSTRPDAAGNEFLAGIPGRGLRILRNFWARGIRSREGYLLSRMWWPGHARGLVMSHQIRGRGFHGLTAPGFSELLSMRLPLALSAVPLESVDNFAKLAQPSDPNRDWYASLPGGCPESRSELFSLSEKAVDAMMPLSL